MDKLNEMFQNWKSGNAIKNPSQLQLFQGGLTSGAVSMRSRATDIISKTEMDNDVKNGLLSAIGSLPDIPA